MFLGFYILPQNGVNRRLIASAVFAKKGQHIGVDPQSDLLLKSRPKNGVLKEIRALLRDVREIDIFIPHRINSLPVRPGALFRTGPLLHDGYWSDPSLRPTRISL